MQLPLAEHEKNPLPATFLFYFLRELRFFLHYLLLNTTGALCLHLLYVTSGTSCRTGEELEVCLHLLHMASGIFFFFFTVIPC